MQNSSETEILLSTAYLPPLSWIKFMVRAKKVYLEQYENFPKQSYRNRCEIYAANGKISLSIPVIQASKSKTQIRDVKIDYATLWQKQHFKSIESAYNSSPYYEYYVDDFSKFYEKKFTFLFDYNLQIIQLLIELLDIEQDIHFTETYQKQPEQQTDYRDKIHPKKQNRNSDSHSKNVYYQVFDDKFGFIPNLSIIDLLFNMGTESYKYI